ncbi:MAG: hypothetical protein JOZ39_11685, partial [Chloroflexi bacterium]|nr:hypothetical protein [Chloroflexota bacterium]
LTVALSLLGQLGFPALVLANTLQNSLHGIILFVLLRRQLGSLRRYTLAESTFKMLLAAAGMAVVALAGAAVLGRVTSLSTLYGQVLQLAIAGGAGLAAYVGLAAALRVDEVNMAISTITSRLRLR